MSDVVYRLTQEQAERSLGSNVQLARSSEESIRDGGY